MEAKEAPEKIYLHPDEDGEVFGKPWSSIPFNKHNVEYTRTDAFIEKVCNFLDDRIKHDSIDYPMATMYLIDDLKRYVEENKL